MRYKDLENKSKEEILQIIDNKYDYQKSFVEEAYIIGNEKGYLTKENLPFPFNDTDMGGLQRTFYRTPFFNKSFISSIILIFVLAVLPILIITIFGDHEEGDSEGNVFLYLSLGFIAFMFIIRLFSIFKFVKTVTMFDEGLKFTKGNKEYFVFFGEISNIQLYGKRGILETIIMKTKYDEVYKINTKNVTEFLTLYMQNDLFAKIKIEQK